MHLRILTPEYYATGILGLMLLCASSSALASYMKLRFARMFRDYDATYAFTLVVVVLYGLLIGAPSLALPIEGSLLAAPSWLAAGLTAGFLAFHADRRIVALIRPHLAPNAANAMPTRQGARPSGPGMLPVSLNSVRSSRTRLFVLLTSAGLEEVAFRGFMLQAFLLVRPFFVQAALVAALIPVFALTHLWFGWTQVAAKLPLAALTLGIALSSGSLTPAIVAHLAFNMLIWRRERMAWR